MEGVEIKEKMKCLFSTFCIAAELAPVLAQPPVLIMVMI